jgi:cytochrome c oxidase subunit 4
MMSTATAPVHHATGHPVDDGAIHPHIVPPRVLLGVYAVLVVLTVATVAITGVNLGPLNIWAALGIAVAKAAFVVLYFMHLKYDKPFNAVVLISALLFVAVFIGIAMMDTGQYKVNYLPPGTRIMVTSQNGG